MDYNLIVNEYSQPIIAVEKRQKVVKLKQDDDRPYWLC
jgi:hypothetical protein